MSYQTKTPLGIKVKTEFEIVSYFTELMNQLALIWPGINNKVRFEQYYNHFKGVNPDYWKQITDSMIDSSRQMPLPNDFREAVASWKRSHSNYSYEVKASKPEVFNCNDCLDSGVVFVRIKSTEPEVFMFCTCSKGEKDSIFYEMKIPRLSKNLIAVGFEKLPFRAEFFKPAVSGANGISFKNIVSAYEKFKEKMNFSMDYFNSLPERQSSGEIKI